MTKRTNLIKRIFIAYLLLLLHSCDSTVETLPIKNSDSDLVFTELATSWDEGIPLGNATIGALIWQKDSFLRFSLDRSDLWDLRPTDSLSGNNFTFEWVKEHIRSNNYGPVQRKLDHPYDQLPAPSKIRGAAIQFPISKFGEVEKVQLLINDALCEIKWRNGTSLQTFVHATKPISWFIFKNVDDDFIPYLECPKYAQTYDDSAKILDVKKQSLFKKSLMGLNYKQGKVRKEGNKLIYHQDAYGDFSYDVIIEWERKGNDLYGVWSINSSISDDNVLIETTKAIKRGFAEDFKEHLAYWDNYWSQSSVTLPDSIIQKQYDNEMYKFASVARENSYPISLQAIWTADNGDLPPWKGDFHHDLNTQLSYWPAYIGNHLSEGMGYLNTLWEQRETYKKYTRQYFGTKGMNIPGVCTITGEPMGGWIQYAMSQTVGAWLAQHFYLHWKYSADRVFLKEKAYPFLKDVAIYMEEQSFIDDNGIRRLEFSSSPEIFDNSIKAWFKDMTNFDLSLMHFIFEASSELAAELELNEEAEHWAELEKQLPDYDLDEDNSLTFAKGFPYNSSHRHFSHALAIHPLGLLDWSDGENAQKIIKATIKKLKDYGSDWWTGYSFSWYANLQARAFNGEEAAKALRTFAECFCLKNTFHANGDQSKSGKSKFQYRPFTLEGNFAFAAAIQEMLLQSHSGVIKIFPAIPESWKNVSFKNLRAMGAFLVSAELKQGKVVKLRVYSEKGGKFRIQIPGTFDIVEYDTEIGSSMDIL